MEGVNIRIESCKKRQQRTWLPENAMTDDALHRYLLQGIDKWPLWERVTFKRFYWDHIPVNKIACELGIPRITVRICLLYGRMDVACAALWYAQIRGRPAAVQSVMSLYAALAGADIAACEARVIPSMQAATLEAIRKRAGLSEPET